MGSVAGLVADGDGIFIGPECPAIEKPGCLREFLSIGEKAGSNASDVVIGAILCDCMPSLEQTVIGNFDVGPTVPIERQAHQQFFCRHAGGLVAGDTLLDTVKIMWFCGEKRRQESSSLSPGAGVVVVHYAHLIDEWSNGSEICAGERLRRFIHCDGQAQTGAHFIHLTAELLKQIGKIGSVFFMGRFPIDVDSVEDSRLADTRCKMTTQEYVDTRSDKGDSVFRPRVLGKIPRVALK